MSSSDSQKLSEGNTNLQTTKKARKFVFTDFRTDSPIFAAQQMAYLAYGAEHTASGQHHWQGMVIYKHPRMLKTVIKDWKPAHVEIMYGTPEDAREYCKKEGNFTEFGNFPAQGQRNDITEFVNQIMEGTLTPTDILMEHPSMYHLYGRTFLAAHDEFLRTRYRTEMTSLIYIFGKTGTGKSKWAFKNFTPDTHYEWSDDNGWWDNYRQQDTVIIDEFRGQLKMNELLRLADRHPLSVSRRGRPPMPFTSRTIIITSALKPSEIYCNLSENDRMDQFYRRATIYECDEFGLLNHETGEYDELNEEIDSVHAATECECGNMCNTISDDFIDN